jgi:hypothetical protein
MNMLAFCQVYVSHIWHVIENYVLCTIYKSSVGVGFGMQIMSILWYNGSLVTWTVVSLTAAKFKPLMQYFLWLASPYPILRTYSFSWFCIISACCCIILLYNRIHTEGSCANRGPLCAFENFQWCEGPCFAGALVFRGRCLPLISTRDKHKSLLIWSVPYGGLA